MEESDLRFGSLGEVVVGRGRVGELNLQLKRLLRKGQLEYMEGLVAHLL